jgi:hypothetical protein
LFVREMTTAGAVVNDAAVAAAAAPLSLLLPL